ncbi:MAG TPA: PilZ domain-containing protein [Tepidisphaeraceae bacterium]|nr:PilZ domain-containing protein [Tepidisphaeraceae bacterium]
MVATLKMSQQHDETHRYQEQQQATPQAYMRLVPAPQGAERRMFERKEVHAHIQGKRLDHSIAARREPFLSLATRDLSIGGLSAISQTIIQRGERVSVYFPPQGVHRGWDALGRVIRCEPSGMGYRVAVEFEQMPLAA